MSTEEAVHDTREAQKQKAKAEVLMSKPKNGGAAPAAAAPPVQTSADPSAPPAPPDAPPSAPAQVPRRSRRADGAGPPHPHRDDQYALGLVKLHHPALRGPRTGIVTGGYGDGRIDATPCFRPDDEATPHPIEFTRIRFIEGAGDPPGRDEVYATA